MKNMTSHLRGIALLGLTGCAGCMPHAESPPAATASPAAAKQPAAKQPAAKQPADPAAPIMPSPAAPAATTAPAAAAAAEPGGGPAAPSPLAAPTPTPDTQQVTAKAGVGLQGQSLRGESGMVVTAARTLLHVKQKAVFDMQIPSALKLYKATEGRGPQSHEEFMSKIITANQIKLPELPPGQSYLYDPQREELMVRQPRP